MKPFYKLLTLIAFFALQSTFVFSQNPPEPCEDGWDCEGNQPGQGTGAATPIDDYAGLLIIAGVAAAGVIYSNKEKMILKK
jgi:hypothetical protein